MGVAVAPRRAAGPGPGVPPAATTKRGGVDRHPHAAREGEAGADRAIQLLSRGLRNTMALLGARTIDELTPELLAH